MISNGLWKFGEEAKGRSDDVEFDVDEKYGNTEIRIAVTD